MGFFSKLFGLGGPEEEQVTSSGSVVRILQHLYDGRTPITLLFDEVDTQYTTMILDINVKDNYFIVDEVAPPSGNRLMNEHEKFHATSSDHGITVKFDGKAYDSGMENNIAFYKIRIPSNLDYQQKREAYRSSLPTDKTVSLTLRSAHKKSFYGHLTDMSMTGCRVRFERNMIDNFTKGEIVRQCTLKFPKETIHIDIEIRHLQYIKGKTHSIMGIHFLDLPTPEQTAINQFLSSIQRESRRRQNDFRER